MVLPGDPNVIEPRSNMSEVVAVEVRGFTVVEQVHHGPMNWGTSER